MKNQTNIHYRIRVRPIAGDGACIIEDNTTTRAGETPEQCVRREAAEAGWCVLEVLEARSDGKLDPDRIGDPAFIKDMRPTVADATGLRAGPCLEVAKELYRDGQTNLPDGLKS